jgi:hypothetical protein
LSSLISLARPLGWATMGFLPPSDALHLRRPEVIKPMDRQPIHILFSGGMSKAAIARKTGISFRTVKRVLK